MAKIIAGRFIEVADANAAADHLVDTRDSSGKIWRHSLSTRRASTTSIRSVAIRTSPREPGPRAAGAAAGAAGGGAAGAAAGAVLGPAGAAAGAAVGAYVGSLPGALDSMHQKTGRGGDARRVHRPPGSAKRG